MKKTTFVAILLLNCLTLSANPLTTEINNIESQWAKIYYEKSSPKQKSLYPILLRNVKALSVSYPDSQEAKIWEAIIIASYAAFESPLTALESVEQAKIILEQSVTKNPQALDGAGLVVLGTLYYMTPGWPISFGDQKKAGKLLKLALTINPNSIDSQYFYADYLLNNGDNNNAIKHFKIAISIPNRENQQYADEQLKKEALAALTNAEARLNAGKNKFLSLFNIAKLN